MKRRDDLIDAIIESVAFGLIIILLGVIAYLVKLVYEAEI